MFWRGTFDQTFDHRDWSKALGLVGNICSAKSNAAKADQVAMSVQIVDPALCFEVI
jgi:hypothetical protein